VAKDKENVQFEEDFGYWMLDMAVPSWRFRKESTRRSLNKKPQQHPTSTFFEYFELDQRFFNSGFNSAQPRFLAFFTTSASHLFPIVYYLFANRFFSTLSSTLLSPVLGFFFLTFFFPD
jgi:hypothetical protein